MAAERRNLPKASPDAGDAASAGAATGPGDAELEAAKARHAEITANADRLIQETDALILRHGPPAVPATERVDSHALQARIDEQKARIAELGNRLKR